MVMTDQEALARIIASAWAQRFAEGRTLEDLLERRKILEGRFRSSLEADVIAEAVLTALPTLDYVKSTRVKELEAEAARLREALTTIAAAHIGDCPAVREEMDHVRAHVSYLRRTAFECIRRTEGVT